MKIKDYQKEWEDFWKDIIIKENGKINTDQIKKELYDYSILLKEVPKVYMDITGGRISKPHCESNAVINETNEYYRKLYMTMIEEDLLDFIEDESVCREDIIDFIKDYFQ